MQFKVRSGDLFDTGVSLEFSVSEDETRSVKGDIGGTLGAFTIEEIWNALGRSTLQMYFRCSLWRVQNPRRRTWPCVTVQLEVMEAMWPYSESYCLFSLDISKVCVPIHFIKTKSHLL